MVLDYDAEGHIVGMEVLDAREHLRGDAEGGLTRSYSAGSTLV
ncbi:DUF2283 domain-containing protein [Mesorhizobium sp. ISC15]